jgi:hypothetical protein
LRPCYGTPSPIFGECRTLRFSRRPGDLFPHRSYSRPDLCGLDSLRVLIQKDLVIRSDMAIMRRIVTGKAGPVQPGCSRESVTNGLAMSMEGTFLLKISAGQAKIPCGNDQTGSEYSRSRPPRHAGPSARGNSRRVGSLLRARRLRLSIGDYSWAEPVQFR